ncbi:MAG TPA: hypothetical protein VKY56_03275 [Chloroflexota bacterium]|nr:hypothetical protein [Chloroflexota bacterium]
MRPDTPFVALDAIAADLDRVVAEWFARARATGRLEDSPTCQYGCAADCSQLVPLSTLDAQRIALCLPPLPRTARREIVVALGRQASRCAAQVYSSSCRCKRSKEVATASSLPYPARMPGGTREHEREPRRRWADGGKDHDVVRYP